MSPRLKCTSKSAAWRRWLPAAVAAGLFLLATGFGLAPAGRLAAADTAPHWAFQPVRDPAPPAVTNAAWCRTSLDRFVLARWEAAGRTPAPRADRRSLLRRVTFDLTGLPPTAEELESFVADPAPDALARRVDRLLESPHYGEHWGRHWLDVVRYADTAGETADYPVPVAWRYRNYVIEAFNADRPYDEFLREQVAGDILAQDGPRDRYAQRVTATGFLALSRRFGFDSENYHHLTIQDTIDTVGQTVLGLTLGCARCHAHKYDPVSLADYYGLYGIFESTRYAFPGSEQKQRTRALVPLVPPGESRLRWREFEQRVASLSAQIDQQKLSVPGGVLRSLDELDGDFELQAPAAGGSKGVLVPPWVYDGPIAVTTEAQSPFRSLYPSGRVGASVAAGTHAYFISQALPPLGPRSGAPVPLHVNLDFRLTPADGSATGQHRFWLGRRDQPAVVVRLGVDGVTLQTGDRSERLGTLRSNQWHSLQLTLDPQAGTVSARLAGPDGGTSLPPRPLAAGWSGPVDWVALEGGVVGQPAAESRPALAFDHLAVQTAPLPPVSLVPPAVAAWKADQAGQGNLAGELATLVGVDGDFELQVADTPPATPWGPGPKSSVQIRAASQSPFTHLYPPGRLGIHLPNSGAYQGYGQTLPQRWTAERTPRLHAAFDFRCADVAAGGEGTWRFYLGHGAGGSAAVELGFNASRFFRRSGDTREPVRDLTVGTWYHVQVTLDLAARRYSGWIGREGERTEFSGEVATGWDGSIDYTFIDSYGHVAGVKPGLDADNFALETTPLSGWEGTGRLGAVGGRDERRARVASLRQRQAAQVREAEAARRELERLLAEGPVELAYAVSEGTPRDARIQLRGEPDRPGDVTPRSLLTALGGGALPPQTRGSGRLELANWLTDPRNPLTARVLVNRVWQAHFGVPLVGTPNDFGTRGQPPTDPDLLDHLATRFMASGWSIKSLHRWILASATYQRAARSELSAQFPVSRDPQAECPVQGMTATPGDRPVRDRRDAIGVGIGIGIGIEPGIGSGPLTESFARRRLGAEELRDSLLRVSGQLDDRPGQGHPFPAPTGWGYTQHGPFSAVYDHPKRSVYLMTQRLKRHPFLALFDGPDPNASTAARRTTTVPTQALYFLNDPFVHASADRVAERVRAENGQGGGEVARIRWLYRRVLAREPSLGEQDDAVDHLTAVRGELKEVAGAGDPERSAWASLARVLLGSNEFLMVD